MATRKVVQKRDPRHRKAPPPLPEGADHAARLLAWYDRGHRRLPWRAAPGRRADPYRVWLSEIMLQQTTVATVGPYFERFARRWPDVHALAAAPLDDVLAEWQGLGYYARARNLKKCADVVSCDLGGVFPDNAADLQRLPGVGPYTAAAIAAIAFDESATVVDGNVERVVARLFAVDDPLPDAKLRLRKLAATLTPKRRAGDYAQAMMDLGATICTPKSPACVLCPVAEGCAALEQGIAAELPRRKPKAERPTRKGIAWLAFDSRGAVLLRRRPEKGLLGGMWEVPSSAWTEEAFDETPPVEAAWHAAGEVVHVFTHFRLELDVRTARLRRKDAAAFGKDARWVAPDERASFALPTVMKKVISAGVSTRLDGSAK